MVDEIAGPRGKVAVLLYGPARTYRVTARSLRRHVVAPHQASLFFYGPAVTDFPAAGHKGGIAQGRFVSPKSEVAADFPVDQDDFRQAYGDDLKAARFHDVPTRRFVEDAATVCDPAEWLYGINPYRILSMCHNLAGVLDLLDAYERSTGERFDHLIFTRTDIAFYRPLSLAGMGPGELHLPQGEGFDEDGCRLHENAPTFFYKNRLTGDYIPGGLVLRFNDQVMAVRREDASAFRDLSEQAVRALRDKVPANTETLLYLLLVSRAGLAITNRPDWVFEICRDGEPDILNVLDTPKFALHDPMHPRSQEKLNASAALRAALPHRRTRTAVLLFGLLREYQTAAQTLMKHVVLPNDAKVFYFGPRYTDAPTKSHVGQFDAQGFFVHNPKGNLEKLVPVDIDGVARPYGSAFARSQFHERSQEDFLAVSEQICGRDDWLLMLNPYRMLSMFYNMQGVARLLRTHERETGETFDQVLITRPDLAFYSRIELAVAPGELQIPAGEGFDKNGYRQIGNAATFFYKDAERGRYVAAGRRETFNDQIMAFRYDALDRFENLFDQAVEALRARVPASPETILYMLLVQEGRLHMSVRPKWIYEIYRKGEPLNKNLIDTLELALIDPHHPKAFKTGQPTGRIAVCIVGEYSNVQEDLRAQAGFLVGVDCDVFVYTTNTEASEPITRALKPVGLIVETRDVALSHQGRDLAEVDEDVFLGLRGRKRVVGLARSQAIRYGRVVVMATGVAVQQGLSEILGWVGEVEYNEREVMVPAGYQADGLNADLAVGGGEAVETLCGAVDTLDHRLVTGMEQALLRQAVLGKLEVSVLPIRYLRTAGAALDFAEAGRRLEEQQSQWWARELPGPRRLRRATSYFVTKYKAAELMLESGTQDGFVLTLDVAAFRPGSQGFISGRSATVNFFRRRGDPSVRAATSVRKLVGAVRRYARLTSLGLDLVLEESDYDLLVTRGDAEDRVAVNSFDWNDLQGPSFTVQVEVGQGTLKRIGDVEPAPEAARSGDRERRVDRTEHGTS